MKVAYFDCVFGAAGDMLLGSLIAAGLPLDQWLAEVEKIALPKGSFRIEVRDVMRCSLAAKKVYVFIGEDEHLEQAHEEHSHPHTQPHEHSHEHSHEHDSHAHAHDSDIHTHHHRNLTAITEIIEQSKISPGAKEIALKAFNRLAAAEAKVHGVSIQDIHFHEVGAVDAIVDIVGFAIAYDMLGIEKSVVSRVPTGSGHVRTQHGLYPIPGPAVLNLLSDGNIPVMESKFTHECLTPTGAALLATVCTSSGSMPAMQINTAGYGAGTFDPHGFPNVCRVIIGTADGTESNGADHGSTTATNFETDIVTVIETNLDDISPQVLSFTVDELFKAGALDVSVSSILMKKGRSGHLLSVVCKPEDRTRLSELMLAHTSSIGVRSYLCDRVIALREFRQVAVGNEETVRVKIARDRNGNLVNVQPEYDDCVKFATKFGVPLKEVFARALSNLKWDK